MITHARSAAILCSQKHDGPESDGEQRQQVAVGGDERVIDHPLQEQRIGDDEHFERRGE